MDTETQTPQTADYAHGQATIIPQKMIILGMELEQWKHKSCSAEFGIGEDKNGKWATLYSIKSDDAGKGHASELLSYAKAYYEAAGMKVGGTVALNDAMRRVYEKLKIEEYR